MPGPTPTATPPTPPSSGSSACTALLVVPAYDRWRNKPLGTEFERQWLWLCQDVDPVWGQRARAGEVIDPVATPALPRYFMLNDRSGFHSWAASKDELINELAHEETLVCGFPRESDVRNFSLPDGTGSVSTGHMIRLVNLGAAIHQMHFHGNHVWTVRKDLQDFPRSGRAGGIVGGHVVLQQFEDVVELDPMQRKEIILPIKRPPDAIDEVWNARTEDWHYPMHCHAEPSQTAAGGSTPAAWWPTGCSPGRRPPGTPPSSARPSSRRTSRQGTPRRSSASARTGRFGATSTTRGCGSPTARSSRCGASRTRRPGAASRPLIRINEDKIAHVTIEPSKRVHTIHLHGMEPDLRATTGSATPRSR